MKAYRVMDQIVNVPDVDTIQVMALENESDGLYLGRIQWYMVIYTCTGRCSTFLGFDEVPARAIFEQIVEETFSEVKAIAR
jgi:hypothetical protein